MLLPLSYECVGNKSKLNSLHSILHVLQSTISLFLALVQIQVSSVRVKQLTRVKREIERRSVNPTSAQTYTVTKIYLGKHPSTEKKINLLTNVT